MPECDFCCLPAARWLYIPQDRARFALMTDDGVVAPIPNNGRWRACDLCSDLVDTDDMERLIARALTNMRVLGLAIPDGGPELEHMAVVVMANFATVLAGRPVKRRL
ncbi:hypothetical protein ACH427_21130 [Streptomyces sp. NPDC020379]|uniref:hypothetical protein n=1 Tax=Streptomyces sp. NPDC020379 TaxID=3365071 RepID=UPI0037AC174A